jgi:hypothetical protein
VLGSLPYSLSDIEGERERIEGIEAVEIEFLSFLNGREIVFVAFCTDFLRDAALPEIEDFVELVSVEFTIMQNQLKC